MGTAAKIIGSVIIAFIVVALISGLYIAEQLSNERNFYKKRKVTLKNGNMYTVYDIPGDKKQARLAAQTLDTVRANLLRILGAAKKAATRYNFVHVDRGTLNARIDRAMLLLGNPENLSETVDSKDDEETSYTVHKSEIFMCIRQGYQRKGDYKPSFRIYPMDQIMYPAIHEMAHMVATKIGHGPEFIEMNGFMLSVASLLGIRYTNRFSGGVYCGKKMD